MAMHIKCFQCVLPWLSHTSQYISLHGLEERSTSTLERSSKDSVTPAGRDVA